MAITTELDKFRKLTIISLFYDDDLLDTFVLKGGNALNIVYGVNNRASMDIDVSMENDFTKEELNQIEIKLKESFQQVFGEAGYHVFDFELEPHPLRLHPEYKSFWGGYRLEFKIIEEEKYQSLCGDIEKMRRQATVVGPNQKRIIQVDISKYEYTAPKDLQDVDGYSIYVYTPLMVVYEKLRAICQQMDEYRKIVPTNQKQRARDFFDIYSIVNHFGLHDEIYTHENVEILKQIFAVKKVPLELLGKINNYREFHRDGFNAVRDTATNQRLESYDFYFDWVVRLVSPLEYLWKDDQAEQEISAGIESQKPS